MDLRLTTILKRVLNQQQQNHSKAKQGDKTKMEEQKFHKLNEGIATRYITLEGMGHKNCKDLQEFLRKLKSQSKDIFFVIDRGKEPGDLAIGSWVTTFFSKKFIDVISKNNVRINAYLIRTKKEVKMNYFYVEPINYPVYHFKKERSKWYLKKNPLAKNNLYQCLGSTTTDEENLFDFSDGSDFFGVKETRFIFVTQKLKEAIEKAKLKNVVFDPVVRYKIK